MNNIIVDDIYSAFSSVETGFNIAACIPVVGLFSGVTRTKVGEIQFKAGLAIGAVGLVFSLATPSKNWENVAYLGGKFMIHGALNAIRGGCESIFGLGILTSPLLIFANIPDFDPWFTYRS